MAKNRLTNNVELVEDLMTFSPFGAMSQMVIIEAITKYVKEQGKVTDEEIQAQLDDMEGTPFINLFAWRNTCKNIDERMEAFYNRDHSLDFEYEDEEEDY